MRILLLSMPNAIMAFEKGAKFPNLGLSSLAGNVGSEHTVRIADLVLCRGNLRRYVAKLLKDFSPHVVGLSCYSFQFKTAIGIARIVKQFDRSIHTVFGGYHPTLGYDTIPENEDPKLIDFIVRNEGELTFRKLVTALEKGQDFSTIDGLSFNVDGQFYHNKRGGNLSLERLQLPDRKARILKGYHAWGLPCDVAETSRGCTFDCAFCTITRMYGRTFRRFPIERIVRDIEDVSRMGAKAIFFVDDNITLNMDHLEEVCDAIIGSELTHLHYITQASVQGISSRREVVDKMAKAGFKTIFLGIENVYDGNLEFLGKDNQVDADATERAVAYLRENKIIVLGAAIVGNPEDDEKAMWRNFHYLKTLKVDGGLFFTPTPLPKTQMRQAMLRQGLVANPSDFTWYMGTKTNVSTKHLTPGQVDRTVLSMYSQFLDFDYLSYNRVRTTYPRYFYKRLLKETAEMVWRKLALSIGMYGKDALRLAIRGDVKRREKWLLKDINSFCDCCNCRFARGENSAK